MLPSTEKLWDPLTLDLSLKYAGVALAAFGSFYLANKDRPFADKQPHHAAVFSLFGDKIELGDCLAPTITDESELRARKDLMRCRMEAFITNLQGMNTATISSLL